MRSDNETLQYDTDEICILKSNNQESLNLKYILYMTFIKISQEHEILQTYFALLKTIKHQAIALK